MEPKLILLVEDDVNLRLSIALILQRAGYLTTETDIVCDAMEFIKSGKYSLIITDVDIQETMDLLLPKILDSCLYMPILILTDQSISENEKEFKSYRLHYLSKPVDPVCILDCVEDILSKNNHFYHPNSQIQINDAR